MGWLENLQNLVDINLGDISILDITVVRIQAEGEGEPLHYDDDELVVDVGSIEDSKREEAMAYVMENYEEGGEIFEEQTYNEKKAIESTDTDRIEDTLEFFRPIISSTHHRILEAALYLREAWEQDREIEQKKDDIVEKYGPDGRYITNLCTAGYFDEGRYFRQLYHELSESEGWKEGEYRVVFEEIIRNQPFTVFVSSIQSAQDVEIEIRGKLRRYERYGVDVKFIDVRGIGPENRETMEEAVAQIKEDMVELEYDEELSDGVSLIRIYTDSVPGMRDATLSEFT